MIKFLAFLAFTFTIMGSLPSLVNAGKIKFTESLTTQKSKKDLLITPLIMELQQNGEEDTLAKGVGKYIELTDQTRVKVFYADFNAKDWVSRACDLVLTAKNDSPASEPYGFVLFERLLKGPTVTIINYRFDLHGRLINAHKFKGKNDEAGHPIRGSAKHFVLDVEDDAVKKDAEKLFDFWLSGAYKKYLEKPETTTPTH